MELDINLIIAILCAILGCCGMIIIVRSASPLKTAFWAIISFLNVFFFLYSADKYNDAIDISDNPLLKKFEFLQIVDLQQVILGAVWVILGAAMIFCFAVIINIMKALPKIGDWQLIGIVYTYFHEGRKALQEKIAAQKKDTEIGDLKKQISELSDRYKGTVRKSVQNFETYTKLITESITAANSQLQMYEKIRAIPDGSTKSACVKIANESTDAQIRQILVNIKNIFKAFCLTSSPAHEDVNYMVYEVWDDDKHDVGTLLFHWSDAPEPEYNGVLRFVHNHNGNQRDADEVVIGVAQNRAQVLVGAPQCWHSGKLQFIDTKDMDFLEDIPDNIRTEVADFLSGLPSTHFISLPFYSPDPENKKPIGVVNIELDKQDIEFRLNLDGDMKKLHKTSMDVSDVERVADTLNAYLHILGVLVHNKTKVLA